VYCLLLNLIYYIIKWSKVLGQPKDFRYAENFKNRTLFAISKSYISFKIWKNHQYFNYIHISKIIILNLYISFKNLLTTAACINKACLAYAACIFVGRRGVSILSEMWNVQWSSQIQLELDEQKLASRHRQQAARKQKQTKMASFGGFKTNFLGNSPKKQSNFQRTRVKGFSTNLFYAAASAFQVPVDEPVADPSMPPGNYAKLRHALFSST